METLTQSSGRHGARRGLQVLLAITFGVPALVAVIRLLTPRGDRSVALDFVAASCSCVFIGLMGWILGGSIAPNRKGGSSADSFKGAIAGATAYVLGFTPTKSMFILGAITHPGHRDSVVDQGALFLWIVIANTRLHLVAWAAAYGVAAALVASRLAAAKKP